jgi:hypothetical protein
MVTMHLRKIVILGFISASLNINAANIDKDLLAQQCRDLSENILSLVSSQGKKSCVEKLDSASAQMEMAGEQIMIDNNTLAKQELENAILLLQHAQLNNCNRYIQISHSIFTAQKIRSAL